MAHNEDSRSTSVRLPIEVWDQIQAEADDRMLGRSKLIELILRRFLKEQEQTND